MSSAPRRRYRVVARPQERARRARLAAAFAAVVLLGAVAAAAVRQALIALAARPASAASGQTVVSAPAPFRALAQGVVDAVPGSAGDKAAALKARFACVADVSVRRAWGQMGATLRVALKVGVAPARRLGRQAGILGDDGTVFTAPDGIYALSGAVVDIAGAGPDDLRALAREWPALTARDAFLSPLAAMTYRSPQDGWQARLEDGTLVQWGSLGWTKEKLVRLSEALADARSREPGVFAADLRYFEDGKLLLKPLAPTAAAAMRARLR